MVVYIGAYSLINYCNSKPLPTNYMTPEEFEKYLKIIESQNNGWISQITGIPPCRVFLDGKELKHVTSVNRKEGKVKLIYDPALRYGYGLLEYMERGTLVTLEVIDDCTATASYVRPAYITQGA